SDGIFIANPQGFYIDVNTRGCEMLGYTRAEILALHIRDIVAEHEIERVEPEVGRLLGGQPVLSEWLFKRKDGSLFPGEVSARRLPDGRLQGIVRDITERKKTQAALLESEARYRTLVEHAPEAILVVDVDKRQTIEANENAVRLFGLPREMLLRTGPVELSPPTQPDGRSSQDLAQEKLRQAVAGEAPVFEWLHHSATGQDIPCEVRLVRLPAVGRVLIRASVTDITQRKKAEALRDGQSRILEMIATSAPLEDTLTCLAQVIEHQAHGMLCSV